MIATVRRYCSFGWWINAGASCTPYCKSLWGTPGDALSVVGGADDERARSLPAFFSAGHAVAVVF
jgi:hypothetical protein